MAIFKIGFSSIKTFSLPMMNEPILYKILKRIDPHLQGSVGHWHLRYQDLSLLVKSDYNKDRLRIMTPIIDQNALAQTQLIQALEVNFDAMMDAKYALGDGLLWAVFAHPFRQLTKDLIQHGIHQVYDAVDRFQALFSNVPLLLPKK